MGCTHTRPRVDHDNIGVVGISNSTQATRTLNLSVDKGSFIKNPKRWDTFMAKIKMYDQHAEFNIDGDPRKVRHSRCRRPQKMDEPYNVSAFSKHVKKCKGPTKAVKGKMAPSGSQSIVKLFSKSSESPLSTTSALPPIIEVPCPGLNPENVPPAHQEQLITYFLRTPVLGAGGPTLEAVTQKMYPKREFSSLSTRERLEVRAAQRQQHCWRIFADSQKVYASTCAQSVRIRVGEILVPSCFKCQALLQDNAFRNALAIPMPAPENSKFTPKHLINRAAVEQYGRISGLGALIDANEKVGVVMGISGISIY